MKQLPDFDLSIVIPFYSGLDEIKFFFRSKQNTFNVMVLKWLL